MSTRQPPNLNTLVALVTLGGGVFAAVKYLAPLEDLPRDQKILASKVQMIENTQGRQMDAIERLTKVSEESQGIRRDVDRNGARIEALEKRVDKLESR